MTGSCTWMIPVLLLALFVSFLQSTPPRCRGMSEFKKDVDSLGELVMNCNENCSSIENDSTCKCLHLNVTEKCDSPDYFINGLKSLYTDTSSQKQTVKHLIPALGYIKMCPGIRFCPPSASDNNETVISPKSFIEKLVLVIQVYNSE